ncbi:MAG TPA: acetyl/propionyl/methylcrotonyl-CoA carboxylase subunit alpha [Bryobacteraceae bacterium]|nr:acetyl/propionyl/methylcrotonyl-CoA carboxylase subunit alpha [Bryobacteraceae bacterium]
MFDKILVANRGEIACRVMRTARRMGVRTVAVYSEVDRAALHVEQADEAYSIGPAPARESYLNIDRILDAARRAGAQAIHPGYGFLSENADFAEACAEAGIVFIGPPAAAIRAMGLKSAAKELMARSGVPVVPGYHGAAQDFDSFAAAAAETGYPVLIKASAGGGGKGMRIVERVADLGPALEAAAREAASSFGDGRLLLEKYLVRPRHIEIQVFADSHGNVVSLFERDCSMQRRYQKVLEEAPAPHMDPERRRSMGEAACAAARAIGYTNAGTVEFLWDSGRFYFMEMNTRLQVEHPVTEAITGLDLVEWQLRVADGEPLPKRAEELAIHGHAIEARVYAEDLVRNAARHEFRPSTGVLAHLEAPTGEHVRVDSGVRAGDAISVHYDPLIAKLIVWGADREEAIARLRRALGAYEIAGVATNIAFLAGVGAHPDYRAGRYDTGFLERHLEELAPTPCPASREILAAAALEVLAEQRRKVRTRAAASGDPWSPWNDTNSWRMNGAAYQDVLFADGQAQRAARIFPHREGGFGFECGDERGEVAVRGGTAFLDGAKMRARAVWSGPAQLTIFADGASHAMQLMDPLAAGGAEEQSGGGLTAPMPGRITQVLVEAGQEVQRGAPLMILEAMKMQYTISAPADGRIGEVRYAAGDVVEEGAELIAFEE